MDKSKPNQLPYNEKDIVSIFNYSKKLINRTLRDFAPNAMGQNGKGGLGQLVERIYFKYNVNNCQKADFAFVNTELKCTPLKESQKHELLIKERLVCSMINYQEDWNKTFEESHFYKKCLIMLILFYLHNPIVSKLDLKFLFAVLWRIPDKDLLIIKHDYEVIVAKIREGQAHLLSEGDTMYLGACRKGQRGDSLMPQHGSEQGAPRRAWSLKTAYMRMVLAEVKENNTNGAYCNYDLSVDTKKEIISATELESQSVDEIIKNRFNPFVGKNYWEIVQMLGLHGSRSKSKYFILANAIAGCGKISNVNRSEEFEKAGLTLKTIRLAKNGRLKESMSFENIDYQEIYSCGEWTDSRLYELFSSRFLFVVFKEDDEQNPTSEEPAYRLEKVAFWTMSQADLSIAEEYWRNIRSCVLTNRISAKYFWKQNDNRCFHVRPKAQNSLDKAVNPNGGKVDKFCYWFNAKYVKNIIENEI